MCVCPVFDVDQTVEPVPLPVLSMPVEHTVDTISGGTYKGNEFMFDLLTTPVPMTIPVPMTYTDYTSTNDIY